MKSESKHAVRQGLSREEGNAIIFVLLLMSFLAALAMAQFAAVAPNLRASTYFSAYSDLRGCAESGIGMALEDLQYNYSGSSGKVGTANWTTADDLGKDGVSGTLDEGEGDGIPTLGEPHVAPVPIGPAALGAGLIVYVTDTAWPDVQHVVATSSNGNGSVTVSTYVRKTIHQIPKVAAVFVDPTVALDLKGNAFLIDGNDHKIDGSPGTGPAVPGIATAIGSPAGSNTSTLLSQIPAKNYDQVIGAGGLPSVNEAAGVDVNMLFDDLKALKSNDLAPGNYTDPSLGTTSAMAVTYVNGDLQLAGKNGQGYGILLVEGSMTLTGQFNFNGIVIVKGDVRLSGGGAGVHIYGSLVVGQSLTAVDPDGSGITVTGNADVYYSSEMLDKVQSTLGATFGVVYYDEK